MASSQDTGSGSAPRSFGWRLWRARHYRKRKMNSAGDQLNEAERLHQKRVQLHVDEQQDADRALRETTGDEE